MKHFLCACSNKREPTYDEENDVIITCDSDDDDESIGHYTNNQDIEECTPMRKSIGIRVSFISLQLNVQMIRILC